MRSRKLKRSRHPRKHQCRFMQSIRVLLGIWLFVASSSTALAKQHPTDGSGDAAHSGNNRPASRPIREFAKFQRDLQSISSQVATVANKLQDIKITIADQIEALSQSLQKGTLERYSPFITPLILSVLGWLFYRRRDYWERYSYLAGKWY